MRETHELLKNQDRCPEMAMVVAFISVLGPISMCGGQGLARSDAPRVVIQFGSEDESGLGRIELLIAGSASLVGAMAP